MERKDSEWSEDLVVAAALLAAVAHGRQPHSGGLHTQHVLRVAQIFCQYTPNMPAAAFLPYGRGKLIAAALLHDVPEDVAEHAQDVLALDTAVYALTMMLRNPSCDMPEVPPEGVTREGWREQRKAADAEHLKAAHPWGRFLKLADRTDNCERSLISWDKARQMRYAGETRRLFLPVLDQIPESGNPYLAAAYAPLRSRLEVALGKMER